MSEGAMRARGSERVIAHAPSVPWTRPGGFGYYPRGVALQSAWKA
jgi:hypothetical protein